MAPPIALVTGGCSGIGLALTKHLLERKWNVVMADINPPKDDLEGTKFVKCDVSSWDDQAALFKQAYEWQGRLDFCALNAGIDDRDDIFNSISSDSKKPPKKPNMKTIDIDLIGPYYGIKLGAHYMSIDSKAAGKPKPGGKIVITASAAGIYPIPQCPQYGMAKHGLVGLVRSLAPVSAKVNIRINAVCPALVKTGLAPPGLLDSFQEEQFTPMSTMLRCFSELADVDDVANENWVEQGKNGETVEGNLDKLIYHSAPDRPDSSSYSNEEGLKAWNNAYVERNKNFVTTSSENGTS
jgi:NAD(P)-dependent dehydrogenase (short-subunit alcohol dehydrogenase family)